MKKSLHPFRKLRKAAAFGTICLALATVLSACGSSAGNNTGSAPSGSESGNPSKGKEPITLTFATFNTWWNYDNLQTAIKMYEEETGNKIDPQIYPDDQFMNIIKAKLATSDVPDVFAFNTAINEFGPGQISPLTGPWVDLLDKSAGPRDGFMIAGDDNVYAAPYGNANFQGMMYNKKVLEQAGVKLPLKTYDEFVTALEAVKKLGITPLYLPNKDGWTAQVLMYIGSQYVPIKEPSFAEGINTNKLKLQDSPLLVDMFKRVLDFKTKGYMNEDMASATMAMAEQELAEGKTAFVAGGNWLYSDFEKNYPEQAADISMTAVNWGDDPADLSVMKTGAGSSLFIPEKSKQKEAAAEFINFVLSEKVMKAMYEAQPGANVLGYDTKANTWDAEMQALLTSGEAQNYEIFTSAISNFKVGSGVNSGDIAATAQAVFAGKDPIKALTDMQAGLEKGNKAKGIPGF